MILFLGDVHGNLDHIRPAIQQQRDAGNHVDAIIFMGDIETGYMQTDFEKFCCQLESDGIQAWLIHGNHDTDTIENWAGILRSAHRNIDGKVVEVAGIRIAGLGGIFRGEVWYPDHPAMADSVPRQRNFADYEGFLRKQSGMKKRLSKMDKIRAEAIPSEQWQGALLDQSSQGKLLKHSSTIFPDIYDTLADMQADILVTHEAPGCHPHGFKALDVLARKMGVKALFHGHHHDALDYRTFDAELGFQAFGVGFCGITNETGESIVAGELDAVRQYRQQRLDGKKQ